MQANWKCDGLARNPLTTTCQGKELGSGSTSYQV